MIKMRMMMIMIIIIIIIIPYALCFICWHNSRKANARDSTGTYRKYTRYKQQIKTNRKDVLIKITLENDSLKNIVILKAEICEIIFFLSEYCRYDFSDQFHL
jgi:flagellar basal body-associated protein FliL